MWWSSTWSLFDRCFSSDQTPSTPPYIIQSSALVSPISAVYIEEWTKPQREIFGQQQQVTSGHKCSLIAVWWSSSSVVVRPERSTKHKRLTMPKYVCHCHNNLNTCCPRRTVVFNCRMFIFSFLFQECAKSYYPLTSLSVISSDKMLTFQATTNRRPISYSHTHKMQIPSWSVYRSFTWHSGQC